MEIAILTVPSEVAQQITDRLVVAGIKGILNMTPIVLIVPDKVLTHNVDITLELQTLIYYIKNDVEDEA